MSLAAAALYALLAQHTNAAEDDWTLTRSGESILAAAHTNGGLVIVTGCHEGQFLAYVDGINTPPRDRQTASLISAEDGREVSILTFQSDTRADSPVPAQLARELRVGGRFILTIRNTDEAIATSSEVIVPTSVSMINETLNACGRPIEDTRKLRYPGRPFEHPPGTRSWDIVPRMQYPTAALRAGVEGIVTLSCVALPSGAVTECVVESESPPHYGFGQASLRSLREARLTVPVSTPEDAGLLTVFSQRWTLPD